MEFLFEVGEVFEIEGRGILLAIGIGLNSMGNSIRGGAPISLHRPDGTIVETTIADLPMICYLPETPQSDRMVPLALPRDISKCEVPIGTRVYVLPPK